VKRTFSNSKEAYKRGGGLPPRVGNQGSTDKIAELGNPNVVRFAGHVGKSKFGWSRKSLSGRKKNFPPPPKNRKTYPEEKETRKEKTNPRREKNLWGKNSTGGEGGRDGRGGDRTGERCEKEATPLKERNGGEGFFHPRGRCTRLYR